MAVDYISPGILACLPNWKSVLYKENSMM